MNKVEIEKNIPVPEMSRSSGPLQRVLLQLEKGDSFVVTGITEVSRYRMAFSYMKLRNPEYKNYLFTTRSIGNNQWRLWRIQ